MPEELVRLDQSWSTVAGPQPAAEYRPMHRELFTVSPNLRTRLELPGSRVDYLSPGDTTYQQVVRLGNEAQLIRGGAISQSPVTYPAPGRLTRTWLQSPLRSEPLSATRAQGRLRLELLPWVDTGGHLSVETGSAHPDHPVDEAFETRLLRGGVLLASSDSYAPSFPVAGGPGTYDIELDASREADWWQRSTSVQTRWTVHTTGVEGEALPMLSVDYTLPLDESNTAPHPRDLRGPLVMQLRIRHQTTGLPAVTGARASVSYDDGGTWLNRPVLQREGGQYEVVLDNPGPDDNSGFASVRVEAWDANGNRIEQGILRAWQLSPR